MANVGFFFLEDLEIHRFVVKMAYFDNNFECLQTIVYKQTYANTVSQKNFTRLTYYYAYDKSQYTYQ